MAVYKRIALVSLVLWLGSTLGVAYILALEDTQRADLDALLADLDTVKGEPRIVLVGSSQVVLGLSADRMTRATGIPARNAGVYAGRGGFREYFRLVMARIRPKDVVIVSPPIGAGIEIGSRHFGCSHPSGLDCVLSNWKAAPRIVEFSQRSAVVPTLQFERDPKGDAVFSGRAAIPIPEKGRKPTFSADSVKVVREQVDMIRARGACPVIAFPPHLAREDTLADWEGEFTRAKNALHDAGLGDVVVETMLIQTDPHIFLHDVHHMNPEGREIWTKLVLDDLAKHGRCGISWGVQRAAMAAPR